MKTILKTCIILTTVALGKITVNAQIPVTLDPTKSYILINKQSGQCAYVNKTEILGIGGIHVGQQASIGLRTCDPNNARFKFLPASTSPNDPSKRIIETMDGSDKIYASASVPGLQSIPLNPFNGGLLGLGGAVEWKLTKDVDGNYTIERPDNTENRWTAFNGSSVTLTILKNSNDLDYPLFQQWNIIEAPNPSGSVRGIPQSTVYPNPVRQGEILTITLPVEDQYDLRIVNTQGSQIRSEKVKGGKVTISTAGMRQGIYYYNAKSGKETVSGTFSVQ